MLACIRVKKKQRTVNNNKAIKKTQKKEINKKDIPYLFVETFWRERLFWWYGKTFYQTRQTTTSPILLQLTSNIFSFCFVFWWRQSENENRQTTWLVVIATVSVRCNIKLLKVLWFSTGQLFWGLNASLQRSWIYCPLFYCSFLKFPAKSVYSLYHYYCMKSI